MKKTLGLAVILLFGTWTSYAQLLPERSFKEPDSSNEYAVYATGGLSNLLYKTDKGQATPSVGYGAGLEYTCNFGQTFGVSVGAEYISFAGTFSRGTLSETYDAIDEGGQSFEYKYIMEKYEESQSLSALALPAMLRVKFSVGRNSHVFVAGGVKFAIPLGSKVKISGKNIRSTGYYAFEDILYENLPQHGFYSGMDVRDEQSSIKGFTTMTILSFEAGLRLGSRRNALYLGAYFDYLPTNAGRSKNRHPMNYNGSLSYESILNSAMASDLKMISTGLKVRFSLF